MAVTITIIAAVGIFRYEQHIDKFVGLITTVWGTFVGSIMDLKKEDGVDVLPRLKS
jgi:hypothetical protein